MLIDGSTPLPVPMRQPEARGTMIDTETKSSHRSLLLREVLEEDEGRGIRFTSRKWGNILKILKNLKII
jgi:hypothetical protein